MTFALPACVNQGNALSLQQQGLSGIRQSQTIDCTALVDFDSSVLAVLMAWQRELSPHQQTLRLIHPPEKLKVLARVYGIADLLGLE
jgi:phospholipid transport system transporter-binding protein